VSRPTLLTSVPPERTDWSTESRDGVREFISVVSRRKVALLIPLILVPALAIAHSVLQLPAYSASADVLVTSGGVASALSDLPGLASTDQPERNAATQIGLARLPRVAERVVKSAPLFEDAETFLARSTVSAQPNVDILTFSVQDRDPGEAEHLATVYAREFVGYRNALDLQAIERTRAIVARSLARLEATGGRGSSVYVQLRQALRRLQAAAAVQGTAAIVVQPAVSTVQVAPTMTRDLMLAIVLGLILGIGLAFLVERLDTRIRSAEEAESILGLPLIGELPEPPPLPQASKTAVAMLEFPYGPYAEGVRKLRANLEFANLDSGARTLMVTSAGMGEGKTTVASDLAVALARSGRSVALVDLDARAPAIARAFDLARRRGLVEVVFGNESLERALTPVSWPAATDGARTPAARAPVSSIYGALGDTDDLIVPAGPGPESAPFGQLHVLAFGNLKPPNPGDFVGSSAVREVVEELGRTYDMVIVDTPPLVPVSDSITISEYVDAALIVCQLRASRRPTLRALRRLTDGMQARMLGLIITGVEAPPAYGPYFVGHQVVRGPVKEEAKLGT
jgi:tyrosine-protein kinase